MMKGLVTVGTSKFDSLVRWADNSNLDLFVQYGDSPKPKNKPCAQFLTNFQNRAAKFDYIVTHAGAGTCYSLLAQNCILVVIPNLNRTDDHQLELAEYLSTNKYVLSLDICKLKEMSSNEFYNTLQNFIVSRNFYDPKCFDFSAFVSFIRGL